MNNALSRRRLISVAAITLGGVALAACGGGEATPTAAPNQPAAGSGGDMQLAIASKGSTPFYDTERLEAKAGSRITLTFTNNAEVGSGKQYNWVLIQPGRTLKVVSDGQSEGSIDTSYVKSKDPNVLVNTKLVGPGESDTITFDAPAPGEYPFVSRSSRPLQHHEGHTGCQVTGTRFHFTLARSELGSRASRSASPKNDTPRIIRVKHRMGKMARYWKRCTYLIESPTIFPQLGIGSLMP